MKLNSREVVLASVTRDLFYKGTPEFRVAKYAHEKGFTELQLQHFLEKMPILFGPIRTKIMNNYRDIANGGDFDEYRKLSQDLDHWLKAQPK